jgi:cytochrome c biogenesis protein CcdA
MRYLQSKKWTGIEVFPFGVIVALSFCPATASIFFGLLVPLAVKYEQMILFPLIYSLGAALPIIAISVLISRGTVLSAKIKWINVLPVISGWILIIIGIYISIRKIYLL